MPLEQKQSSFSTNRIPVKLPREVTLLLSKSYFLSISLLSVSSKDRDCLWSSVRIFVTGRRHLEILALILFESEAALLGKWADPCVCLFLPFLRVGESVRSLGRSWMNKIAEKKTHRKKHGMDFSAVWIIWNHVSLKIFDFKPIQVVELERQSPSKAVQDGTTMNIVTAAKTAEPHPKIPEAIYTTAQKSIFYYF